MLVVIVAGCVATAASIASALDYTLVKAQRSIEIELSDLLTLLDPPIPANKIVNPSYRIEGSKLVITADDES